eukprot:5714199-Lingulodinium_polyedra.AAC.1
MVSRALVVLGHDEGALLGLEPRGPRDVADDRVEGRPHPARRPRGRRRSPRPGRGHAPKPGVPWGAGT